MGQAGSKPAGRLGRRYLRLRMFAARITRTGLAKTAEHTVGIDISKAHLGAFRHEDPCGAAGREQSYAGIWVMA